VPLSENSSPVARGLNQGGKA